MRTLLAAVLGLVLFAGQAQAAPITTLSFNGTASGYDGSSLFYASAQNYNAGYTATISWDPLSFSACNSKTNCNWAVGAGNHVVETVTINNHTVTLNVTSGSIFFNTSNGTNDQIGFSFGGTGFSLYGTFMDTSNFFGSHLNNLTPALNFSNAPLSSFSAGGNQGNTNFQLQSSQLSAVTTSVPEPSSLALLGVALVGLGAARRRRA